MSNCGQIIPSDFDMHTHRGRQQLMCRWKNLDELNESLKDQGCRLQLPHERHQIGFFLC